ncbi:group 1 glycosyl transferase [Fictibacillus macauensis ZFHKF-1]|uniref:Group 1 glycosyl transferase n=1 Tax=Fictibacillus macauensis ZFHKF-1 TaxID=1196324 RepID=I8UI21_9BACL|nr:glycosyltransferase [Fictibacillus macauensis]EIT86535.1 group 1 glycosyl transferase [Fictibacillus macauensis ZFHKF-1]
MKQQLLIASFDLAIGGVERSLIGLLNSIDYTRYDVDVMLFKHEGEFMSLFPEGPTLLPERKEYATFRQSVKEIAATKQAGIAAARLAAKYAGELHGKWVKSSEPGYSIIQFGWEWTLPLLPSLEKEYDAAISFLWPHHFVAHKVKAKKKIGWIHTDYSNITLLTKKEEKMWKHMDAIAAVSESCETSFLQKFPNLQNKMNVIENILSPTFIREQADEIVPAFSKSATTLVTVGRFSYAKGIDEAIRACRILVDQGHNIHWHVVGYGPQEQELQSLISELRLENHFFLAGKKSNPYPYIKGCDLYVQPSRYEGKAVTVREAQILHKPVVITNFPTAASQLEHNVDGFITEMGPEGIAKGISTLLHDQKRVRQFIETTKQRNYGNSNEVEKLYELISS